MEVPLNFQLQKVGRKMIVKVKTWAEDHIHASEGVIKIEKDIKPKEVWSDIIPEDFGVSIIMPHEDVEIYITKEEIKSIVKASIQYDPTFVQELLQSIYEG